MGPCHRIPCRRDCAVGVRAADGGEAGAPPAAEQLPTLIENAKVRVSPLPPLSVVGPAVAVCVRVHVFVLVRALSPS